MENIKNVNLNVNNEQSSQSNMEEMEIYNGETFKAICRDSMSPLSLETFEEFKKGEGKAYVYANAIRKNYPNVEDVLSKLNLNKQPSQLTNEEMGEIYNGQTFNALCRDSMSPLSLETLDEFTKGEGKAYEYANAIRKHYPHVEELLSKLNL